jgi:Zn-finger nucleic acid-binding protein
MKCPDCSSELKVCKLKGISIQECLKCKGKWFGRNELMLAKDKTDDGLRWLDFDPFGKDAEQLSVASDGKQCPACLEKMQSLTYSQSKIVIDKCQSCQGVWISHGELARIIRYLENAVNTESVRNLGKETFKEFIGIFRGQKGLISEVKDFLAVLNILETRIAVENPQWAQSWLNIESISPFK